MTATGTPGVTCTSNEAHGVEPSACSVFMGLADAVVVHDIDDHRVRDVNPVLAEWIETDDPGGEFFELFAHDVRGEMRRTFSSRGGELRGDYRLGRGRRVRWVELTTQRGKFQHGEAWITTMRDVTEQRRALERADTEKARADDADRRRRKTVAALGHELRNPISAIVGVSQALAQAQVAEEHREYVDTIHTTAQGLMDLLSDTLDLTRLENGEFLIEESVFSPRDVCESCVKTSRESTDALDLEVGLEIGPDVPALCIGDAARIQQILSNLVANALRYTHRGHVTLSLQLEDLRAEHVALRFAVSDSGIGFDEAVLPTIFEPFAQAAGSSGSPYGTGLGLSLSHQLVRLMGSAIEVDSSVGRGSRFHFVLVLKRGPDDPVVRTEQSDVLYVGAAGPRRKAFADALRARGRAVETCESSTAGLERVRTRRAEGSGYSLVCVEQQLPDLDGETFARSIRHHLRALDVRLILVTSPHNAIEGPRAARSGFDLVAAGPDDLPTDESTHSDRPAPVEPAEDTAPPAPSTSPDASAPPKPPASAPSASDPDILTGPPRVLVVEDNPVNQKVVCHMLRKMGFTVELAPDGEQGVERLSNDSPFDLVLMDCQMPVMDGYQATRAIREIDGTLASTPIIALTANAMDGDREKCLASGMDDYLSKPAKANQLREMLTKWIPACEERLVSS